jgi:protein-L-isoaspartate O-methyltransferase
MRSGNATLRRSPYAGHLTSPAVIRAFSRVPRERFLGPGPWRIYQGYTRQYWTTPDADPQHVYHDVLVAIDETRLLNNLRAKAPDGSMAISFACQPPSQ